MRILLTNNTLAGPAGSELYLRDLALALRRRGHEPIAYSPELGTVAAQLRAAGVTVIDDLDAVGAPPDVIHGQHHLETLTALLRFPRVAALAVCHGAKPWQESPVRAARVRQHVAVDASCAERLAACGIPPVRVRVIHNFVDLVRFVPRAPLPARPARALVLSNQAALDGWVGVVRAACEARGVALDVVGAAAGTSHPAPETILGTYDVVFAKGRAALEAMAVGCAVVLCDRPGLGPLVTRDGFAALRPLNFGFRTLTTPIALDAVAARLAAYDPAEVAALQTRVRAEADLEGAVTEFVGLYEAVRAAQATDPTTPADDAASLAADLRAFGQELKHTFGLLEAGARDAVAARLADQDAAGAAQSDLQQRLDVTTAALRELERHYHALDAERRGLRAELAEAARPIAPAPQEATGRGARLAGLPFVGGLLERLARRGG